MSCHLRRVWQGLLLAAGSPSTAGSAHPRGSGERVLWLLNGGGHVGCHRGTPELIGGNSVLAQTLQDWNLGTDTGRFKGFVLGVAANHGIWLSLPLPRV